MQIITLNDTSARIRWINAELPPVSREDIIGSVPWDWVEGDDIAIVREAYSKVILDRVPIEFEVTQIVPDLELHRCHIRLEPIEFGPLRIVCMAAHIPLESQLLTKRERDVLACLAQGCSNEQAATQLGIATRTVESHRTNIRNKLNDPSTVGMVRLAMDLGLIE